MSLPSKIKNTEIDEGNLGIFWLGQAGFIFKDSRNIVYVDPYLSDYLGTDPPHGFEWKRLVESPIKSSEVKADIIAITHSHQDHLDPVSLPIIAKSNEHAKLLGPTSCCWRMAQLGVEINRIIEMEIGVEKQLNGIKIKAVPAHHPNIFSPQWDAVGYIFNFCGVKVYFTGDSLFEWEVLDVKHDKPIDIMIVCINGSGGNMNEEEAAVFTKEIAPKIVIPMHYGMYKESGPGRPDIFENYLKKLNVKSIPKIMSVGDCFIT